MEKQLNTGFAKSPIFLLCEMVTDGRACMVLHYLNELSRNKKYAPQPPLEIEAPKNLAATDKLKLTLDNYTS